MTIDAGALRGMTVRDLLRCVALTSALSALACTQGAENGGSPGSPGGKTQATSDAGGVSDAGDGGDGGDGGEIAQGPLQTQDGSSPLQPLDAAGVGPPHDGGDSGSGQDIGTDRDAGGRDASLDASAGSGAEVLCLSGGDAIESSASGACDDPIEVDLRDAHFGDVLDHVTQVEATVGLAPGIGKCAATTERNVVYRVRLPSEGDLELSVDADEGADPIILVQDGPDSTCTSATTLVCVDDYAEGTCEHVRISAAALELEDDTAQVVIAETVASERALHVRFRLVDPAGGS